MIDLLFTVTMGLAIWKGYRKGLVVAFFSLLAFIVGLAAAIKLSAVAAVYLKEHTSIQATWLPVIAFLAVFISVVVIINLGARLLESSLEMVQLGWANKIGGILFYALLYCLLFSVFLFYAEKIGLFREAAISSSIVYPVIRPWAPGLIQGISHFIPFLQNSFQELEDFFGRVSDKIPAAVPAKSF